ncbi:hypothetical protein ACOSQ3_014951 [Xanthoceras sorbifolium]
MWDSRRKVREPKEENVTLRPTVRDGEHVFGHVTDLSGRETLVRITDGMKVKADRDESSLYAIMLAAQDISQRCKELGITALHIKLRATGTDFNPSYLCKNDFDFHIFMFGA